MRPLPCLMRRGTGLQSDCGVIRRRVLKMVANYGVSREVVLQSGNISKIVSGAKLLWTEAYSSFCFPKFIWTSLTARVIHKA